MTGRERLESALVSLDELPWSALLRAAGGFISVPIWHFGGGERIGWSFAGFIAGMLLLTRCACAAMRRVLPISEYTQARWAARRELGRRYDSYQWQKLLWFGVGVGAYGVYTQNTQKVLLVLAALCVVSGAAGLLVYRGTREKKD